MRKRMSRVLSILMASVLVVSAGSVVRAEEFNEPEAQETVQAAEKEQEEMEEPSVLEEGAESGLAEELTVPDPVSEETVEAEIDEKGESKLEITSEADDCVEEMLDDFGLQKYLAAGDLLTNAIYVNKVNTFEEARVIVNDTSKLQGSAIAYYQDSPFSKPIGLNKGSLIIGAYGLEGSATDSYVGIYRDPQLTSPVGREIYVSRSDVTQKIIDIPSTGNYYFGVKSTGIYQNGENLPSGIGLCLCFFDGADRTIKNKEKALVGQVNGDTVNYFKFKATSTGYISTATDADASSVTVTLCNSKKKALSGETSARLNPTFGVKKGKTYWIKLSNPYSNKYGFYMFTLKNVKITEKSGKTDKKAVTIKKNRTKKGTIEAGSKQADWYKFTLTSNKKVKIAVAGGTNDEIKFVVYQKVGKKLRQIGTRRGYNNFKGKLESAGKWSKGTYYVKVQRGNSKSSGYYTMKLK